jgi:hypothetical protein
VEVPNGTVTGTITYDGQTVNVTGSGYHDHNWGNIDLTAIFKYWWWSRLKVDDYTIIASSVRHKHKYTPEWTEHYVVLDTNGVVIDASESDVTSTHKISDFGFHPDALEYPNGLYPYCLEYQVTGNNESSYLRLDSDNLIWSVSPLQVKLDLDPLLINLLKMFNIKPWYTSMSISNYLELNTANTSYQGTSATGTKELMDLDGNRLYWVGKKSW